jgi:hypothetical protein
MRPVCTPAGLPVAFALTGAKADERETLLDMLAIEPQLTTARPGQTLIGDKNYFGREFEQRLAELGVRLLRPRRKGEAERPRSHLFKPLRQIIESINETFKGQLDLERPHGRTPAGVTVRILQRILALTAAIWHNDHTGQPIKRSLTVTHPGFVGGSIRREDRAHGSQVPLSPGAAPACGAHGR